MQCEILAFKKVRTGRVALVRIPQGGMIGECPVSNAAVLNEGDVAELKSKLRVIGGRLQVQLMVDAVA